MEALKRDLTALQKGMSNLTLSVGILENQVKNDSQIVKSLGVEVKKLNTTLIELNSTLAKMNGQKEGATQVVKITWALLGSLFIAATISGATIIVDLKSEVAVLKEKSK